MRKRKQSRKFQIRRESKRVAILTPCNDLVTAEYAMSLVGMMQHTAESKTNGLEFVTVKALGTSVLPKGRQTLCDAALNDNVTHVLWIDSDMKFPADMLIRCLRYAEPIVGINAMMRRPPYLNCAQYENGQPVVTSEDSAGLEKVARAGFGVLWVSAQVMREMERPFFQFEYGADGKWYGEDYYFTAKAKALGFDCHIDHDLSKQITHIGSFGYNPLLADVLGAK